MNKIPLVWSNDDIAVGKADKLRRQLEFIDWFGIPGVFFVIPESDQRTIAQDSDLLGVIEKARPRGHEFFQHGYLHTPFESGVPETWMLDFSDEVRRQYDSHRLEIEQQHTLDAMVRKLDAGQRIWRQAFQEDSVGYRPGWGSFCTNLYRALDQKGYQWVSSRIPSATSWRWNNGQWQVPMEFRQDVPASPHRMGRLIEYPMAGDYAFNVPDDPAKIDAMVNLGLTEMTYLHEHGWPMIICSHWHGLERHNDSGYRVHQRLLPDLLATGKVEPMNMTALTRIGKVAPEPIPSRQIF